MENIEKHKNIINHLGGGKKLTARLKKLTSEEVNEKTVYSWVRQGIPDKWKPSIIKLLIKVGANIPNNFMPPGMNINNFQSCTPLTIIR